MSSDRHWTTERSELAKAYPGRKWYKKVLEMSDEQVHAVYINFLNRKEKANDHLQERKTG